LENSNSALFSLEKTVSYRKGGRKVGRLTALLLSAEDSGMYTDRIFGLDFQFLADALILMLAVFVLFVILSYLVFNPARELLRRRQEKIQGDLDSAEKEKQNAGKLKSEYDAKLRGVEQESEEILSETRKKALKKEAEIIDEAKAEAARILDRANKEVELEKNKVRDEVKKEMIGVAAAMAGKLVAAAIDEDKQDQLIEETLSEMGDSTWSASGNMVGK